MNSFNSQASEDMNEYNIYSWLSHNMDDACEELGENLVDSILEGIDYE